MTTPNLENINVSAFDNMPTPAEIHAKLPISDKAAKTVNHGRSLLRKILDRKDHRLFVVVGPCSIHDPVAGLDYAHRLKKLADEVGDTLQIIMRVYFEKPRTTVGWKGYINDPFMDDSFQVNVGMEKARDFLLQVNELGLPAGTEALDPYGPQYYGDLIAWTAIGARTTESQTHREMSSGLSTPVGFKNATSGDLTVATNPNLETYRSGQLRAIAAGTGPTFSSVARKYDGTYSAQRQELIEGYGVYSTLASAACTKRSYTGRETRAMNSAARVL
jgi:3-deoxy-7-phosphoheptulonate synthase